MEYLYKMLMVVRLGGVDEEFENVEVHVVATNGQDAVDKASELLHEDYYLEYSKYISITAIT